MKDKQLYSRRNLVKLMTRGVASSVLLPSIMPRAFAQNGLEDRKVLFVYCDSGATTRFMDMRPPWLSQEILADKYSIYNSQTNRSPDDAAWEFSFTDGRLAEDQMSQVLAPLWNVRDKVNYYEGLSMNSTNLDNNGDAHAIGHLACMSGTVSDRVFDDGRTQGSTPSLDQRLNDYLKLTQPSHKTLSYRIENVQPQLYHEFLYYNANANTGGQPDIRRVNTEYDTQRAFDRLFEGREFTGNPLDAKRGEIFNLLNGEYSRLARRMSAEDLARLESHRYLLNELNTSLGFVGGCDAAPERPDSATNNTYNSRSDTFAQMIATAFSCGISRVSSLGVVWADPEQYGLDDKGLSIHTGWDHFTRPSRFYEEFNQNPEAHGAVGAEFLEKEAGMAKRNTWQVERLAEVARIFANTPDSSGSGSLLDSTLIVYVNELSHGGHGHGHWPLITIGDFGGAVTSGRYIKYPQNIPAQLRHSQDGNSGDFVGVSHTKFFISVLQSMGMDIDSLQAPSFPGTRGNVELGGPLPRFKI